MSWIIFTLAAVIIGAAANLIDKFVMDKEMNDPIFAAFVAGMFLLLFSSIATLLFGTISTDPIAILFALLAGISLTFGLFVYYTSLEYEESSRAIAIMSISPVFVALLSFFFLDERLTPVTYIGIALLVLGAMLISLRRQVTNFRFSPVLFIALVAAYLFSMKDVLSRASSFYADFLGMFIWVGAGSGLAALSLLAVHHDRIGEKIVKGKRLWLANLLASTQFFLLIKAVTLGPASLVAALLQIKPLVLLLTSVVLSRFFPRVLYEPFGKGILIQKVVAGALILAGAFLVV